MKRWPFLILLSLLMVFTCCNRKPRFSTLATSIPMFSEVYSLKETHPDIALHLMESMSDTLDEKTDWSLHPFLFHEYQILKAEIHYKNHRSIPNDSLVEKAYKFYDSIVAQSKLSRVNKTLLYQYAHSLFYHAAGKANKGQAIESYSLFMRSLEVMDELTGKRHALNSAKTNIEYEHFTALIYTRLASFLYPYDAWDVAFEVLEKSNESFKLENNLLGIADNYEVMGDIMLAQSDRTTALKYYKASDSIHEILHTDNVYQNYSTLIHQAINLYNEGLNDSVYRMLHQALYISQNDYVSRKICYSLGYFYYHDHILDSALTNYEKSFPLLPRQTLRSLCRIVQISEELSNTEKAAHYGALLADNYLEQHAMASTKTKMITLYEQYKSDQRDAKNKDLIYFILALVMLLGFVLVFDTFWLERRRRRNKKDKEKHEYIKSQLESQIEQVLAETRDKNEKINVLEEKLKVIVANPDFKHLPFDKKLETLYNIPISKRILKVKAANVKAFSSYPELVLSENQLSMLVNAVDTVFPKFSVKIIEMYPRIKRSDVVYCCLYILGITEVQAAALTGKTYQAVWTRSFKLHEIFDNRSNLQFVLFDLLKDWKS